MSRKLCLCIYCTSICSTAAWLLLEYVQAERYFPRFARQYDRTDPCEGILIAEFGFNPFMEYAKTTVAQLYDLERTLYYQWFLRETLKSIYEDGVNVIGALAWSFLDNDEFTSYLQQYGLQHVNRTNGEFTRSYKRSIFDYVDFFHEYVSS